MADRQALSDAERQRVAEVFETHGRLIEGVALSQVHGDRAEAAEVVQDVAVLVCRHLNGLRDPAAIRSWLYQVTVRAAVHRYRAQASGHALERRVAEHTERNPTDDRDPGRMVFDEERRARLHAVMRHCLSPIEREALRRQFDLAYPRAHIRRVPRSTLHDAKQRGLERLREILGSSKPDLF